MKTNLISNVIGILTKIYKYVKDFCLQYPAVLCGYVIYSYLFISIMQFYMKAKAGNLSVYDTFTIFSALPFMWFLSVALVKIIEIKTKLYESEQKHLIAQKELELKQTQLQTMKETVLSLQHHINNPLAVIMLSLENLNKNFNCNKETVFYLNKAKESIGQIQCALVGFSNLQDYKTENIDGFYKMTSIKPMLHVH